MVSQEKRSTSHTEHGIIQQAIATPDFKVTKNCIPHQISLQVGESNLLFNAAKERSLSVAYNHFSMLIFTSGQSLSIMANQAVSRFRFLKIFQRTSFLWELVLVLYFRQ
jgi:hypothetical protein